jgi:hypothetical protein
MTGISVTTMNEKEALRQLPVCSELWLFSREAVPTFTKKEAVTKLDGTP